MNLIKNFIKIIIENIIHTAFYFIYKYYSIKNNYEYLTFNDIIKNHYLCCHAPYIGNFAFPDYYSVYFITFFSPNQKISYNSFKNIYKSSYIILSITFYDNTGKIIEYYDDSIISEEYITNNYCLSIIRIYSKKPSDTLQYLINENNINITNIKRNTEYFTYFYKKIILFKKLDVDWSINSFRFSKENLSLYFTNYRARYLILPINNIEKIIIIKSKKPVCGIKKSLRYFGFMICNMNNTETDSCINYDDLEDEYTIFIGNLYLKIKKYGYDKSNKSHKIIYLNFLNKNPIIVYREIRINNEGLFSLSSNASQYEIKNAMGDYFPNVIVYE